MTRRSLFSFLAGAPAAAMCADKSDLKIPVLTFQAINIDKIVQDILLKFIESVPDVLPLVWCFNNIKYDGPMADDVFDKLCLEAEAMGHHWIGYIIWPWFSKSRSSKVDGFRYDCQITGVRSSDGQAISSMATLHIDQSLDIGFIKNEYVIETLMAALDSVNQHGSCSCGLWIEGDDIVETPCNVGKLFIPPAKPVALTRSLFG